MIDGQNVMRLLVSLKTGLYRFLSKHAVLTPLSAFRFNFALARAKLKSAVIYCYLKLHAIVCKHTQAPLIIEWRLLYLFMLFLYSFISTLD